jgi:hypothetical protein
MAFDELQSDGLGAFLDRNFDPEALWLFVHIPKTAGSSLANEIARLRRPYRNIHVDYEDKDTPHEKQMQAAVDAFIRDAQEKRFRSASGHITAQHARQIREAVPNTRLVTVLRDPVARVISDYRYARTPSHPPYQDFIRRFPTINHYVESRNSQNKMVKHLGSGKPSEVFEEFTFLGALELYPMSFNILFRLMGENVMPQLHERKTEGTANNKVELTPELTREIKDANAEDVRIFNAVRDALRTQRNAWAEIRKKPGPKGAPSEQPA